MDLPFFRFGVLEWTLGRWDRDGANVKRKSWQALCLSSRRLVCLVSVWGLLVPSLDSGAEPQPSPPDEKAWASLGAALFIDTSLSADGKVACATCHPPDAAFTDGKPVSRGVFDRTGTRNVPSLWGLASAREFFWDGRRASLETLMFDPLTTAEEHGMEGEEAVISSVQARYSAEFERLFPGRGATRETVSRVLAAYVRQQVPPPSPFEQFLSGDAQALRPEQRRGFALFTGRAGCARCHPPEGGAFTDGSYHAGEISAALIAKQAGAARELALLDPGARRAAVSARAEVAALGRYVVTLRASDLGRFRTPSLRNVAVTVLYMRDGSVPTLIQAVERELYYRLPEGLQVGDMTPSERSDIVAFLHSLTSPAASTGIGR